VGSSKATFAIADRRDTEIDVHIDVPDAAVSDAIDEVYDRYARRAHVPGFRKGHVPRAYLESRFGADDVAAEARATLHETLLREALSSLELRPVAPVSLSPGPWNPPHAYSFTVTVPVLPDVTAPPLEGIRIEVPAVPSITEAHVKDALEQIRWRYATLSERPADADVALGDVVWIEHAGQEGQLLIEEDDPLGQRLVGHRVGERVAAGTEDTEEPVTLLGISEAHRPALDDDLARDAGHDSLAAMREDIRARLERSRARRMQEVRRAALLDALLKRTEIPLPEALLDELVQEEIERLREELGGRTPPVSLEDALAEDGQTPDALAQRIRERIADRLRRDLLIDRLIEEGGTRPDDAELETIARAEAEAAGENPMRAIARLKGEGRWEGYRRSHAAEVALDRLLEAVEVREIAPASVDRPEPTEGKEAS
jgi:trigger factor